MVPTVQEISIHTSQMTLVTAFVAGVMGSLNLCAAIRLPVVLGYIAGMGHPRKRAVILSLLCTLGLVTGIFVLGLTAATADDGVHRVLHVNKGLFWACGPALFLVGMMTCGVIAPQLLPEKWRAVAGCCGRAAVPGAFLLGGTLGLLQTPACPGCRAELLTVVEAAATTDLGFVLLIGSAVGQGLLVLGAGLLMSLMRPDLVLWLRTRMCSIEQRVQLLAGNVLMVLGIYFTIVG